MRFHTVIGVCLVLFGVTYCQQQVATQDIVPVISCVEDTNSGTFIPRFGYTNFNDFPVYIPRGPNNDLREETTNVALFPPHIDTFLPGNHMDVFTVRADDKWTVAWKIMSPNGHINIIRATKTNQPSCTSGPTAPPPVPDLCANKVCGGNDQCCNNTAIGGFAQCFAPTTHWCCLNDAGKMMLCGLDSNACCGNACYFSTMYKCSAGQLIGIIPPASSTSATTATSTTAASTTAASTTAAATTGTTTGTTGTTTGTTGIVVPTTCEGFNGANGVALDKVGCLATAGCSYCNLGSPAGLGICYNISTQCCANTGSVCSGGSCVVCEAGGCCGGFWAEDPAKCCTRTESCCSGIRHSFCCDAETEDCCSASVIPCCVPKGTPCQYTADNIQCSFNSTAV